MMQMLITAAKKNFTQYLHTVMIFGNQSGNCCYFHMGAAILDLANRLFVSRCLRDYVITTAILLSVSERGIIRAEKESNIYTIILLL